MTEAVIEDETINQQDTLPEAGNDDFGPEAANDDIGPDGGATVDAGMDALIAGSEGGVSADTLVVDVEGYEGPLDMLLALSRAQKVDITKISIIALADQFLEFIEKA